MKLRQRLARLEQRCAQRRCPGCDHRRGRVILMEPDPLTGGSVEKSAWPAPCSRCGQVPEFIVEIVGPGPNAGTPALGPPITTGHAP
jgi:hypothetical protein